MALAGLAVAAVPFGPAAAFGAPAAAPAAAPAVAASGSGCADVEVVVSRGTSEPGTIGSLSVVANAITKGTTRTVSTVGNPYPASFAFASSTPQGVTDLTSEITRQAAACPAQKFVLLGYSQGAIVVGDVLGGGSFTASKPLPAALGDKVIAAVMWGDPRFNSAEPFDGGTFTKGVNGTFVRTAGSLKAFNARLLDFCLAADGVCQGNGTLNINAGHLSYPTNSAAINTSAQFAIDKINAGTTASSSTGAANGGTTSAPATPMPAKRHWWQKLFG
jgi:hypothetical protein